MLLRPIEPLTATVAAPDGTPLSVHTWPPRAAPWLRLVVIGPPGTDTRAYTPVLSRLARISVMVESIDLPPPDKAAWADMISIVAARLAAARNATGQLPVALLGARLGGLVALDGATGGAPDLLLLANPPIEWRLPPAARLSLAVRARVAPRAPIQLPDGSTLSAKLLAESVAAQRRVLAAADRLPAPTLLLQASSPAIEPRAAFRIRVGPGNAIIFNRLGPDLLALAGEDGAHVADSIRTFLLREATNRWPEVTPAQDHRTSYERLTRKEAEAHLRWHVATESERAEAFVEQVRAEGGPVPGTTPEALAALGAWVAGTLREGERDGEVPRWARDASPLDAVQFSAHSLWLVDGLAAWVTAQLRRLVPDARWSLETDKRLADYHQPVLKGPGVRIDAALPARVALADAIREPPRSDWLAQRWGAWTAHIGRPRAADGADADDWIAEADVEPRDGDDWNAQAWIPETAETMLGAAIFETLDRRIGALPGVERLAWEDREVMLLRVAPGIELGALRTRIVASLRAAAAEAEASGDDDDD